MKKSKLAIEYWPVAKLIPYERNPRKNDKSVSRMVASIAEYGFTIPVLAQSNGTVIDGHLRLKAAVQAKLREVPVIPCDGWTDAQVKAFRLMVNRSVAWADWDIEALMLEFAELKTAGFDLSLTGFDSREIDGFTLAADKSEDDVPPLPVDPITNPGDLWILGNHRLLCGDSTAAESVARLFGGAKPQIMVTDPPYGVEYEPSWREKYDNFKRHAVGLVQNDDRVDWHQAFDLFPGDVAYVWHAGVFAGQVADGLAAVKFKIRAQIIWKKQHFVFGRGSYHWEHEPCWYAVRCGSRANWRGDRKQTTVWEVQNLNPMGGNSSEKATGHGTQKPVEIMRRPILNHTVPGDTVYDPFLGSGTTLIAAELTGRSCFGLEIDPAYCDVIVKRWETISGKNAVLESKA